MTLYIIIFSSSASYTEECTVIAIMVSQSFLASLSFKLPNVNLICLNVQHPKFSWKTFHGVSEGWNLAQDSLVYQIWRFLLENCIKHWPLLFWKWIRRGAADMQATIAFFWQHIIYETIWTYFDTHKSIFCYI